MKRVKTIAADDGCTKVVITIMVNTYGGRMKWETDNMVEGLTSSIMAQVPNAPMLGVRLSQVRVK